MLRDPALQVVGLDLTDESATRKLLLDLRPHAIVHCAAATNVDWCEDNPEQAEAINVHASAVLADVASALNAHFLYVSTDAVFDGKKGDYLETDEPAPVNVYAKTKLAAERETLRLNPSALIARVNIYGWNAQNKDSLAEWILRRLENGADVPGFTDVFFTPTLVNALIPVLFAMSERKLTGLYHVAGSEKISKFEFARKVAAIFGFDPARITPCNVNEVDLRAVRPLDISLNVGKTSRALDRSMPTVDAGLREFRDLRGRHYPQKLKSYLDGGRLS
jgi:dTDP-4-dehydrorhamnose reductase